MLLGRPGLRGGRPGLLGMAARTAVVAGTATAVSGRVQRHQADRTQERAEADASPPQQEPPPPAADMDETIAQLQKLGALRDQGVLTDDEFAAQKARLLGS